MNKTSLKDWEFLSSEEEGGIDNRRRFIAVLTEFFFKGREKEISLPGAVHLRGKIYGCDDFPNGTIIHTSRIVKIRKVDTGADIEELFAGKCSIEEYYALNENKQFCAFSESGNEYYFFEKDMSAEMFMALGDYYHIGIVSPRFMQLKCN